MDSKEIVLWLDERWYKAISKQFKDETLEAHLEKVLDELCNALPEREYARISREIFEEESANRQAAEDSKQYVVFRVTENGDIQCRKSPCRLTTFGAANLLREYLRREPDEAAAPFAGGLGGTEVISDSEYDTMLGLSMKNPNRVTAVFDINFDTQEFSVVKVKGGWSTYAFRDVSAAAYYAAKKQGISSEERDARLYERLEGKKLVSAGHLSAREIRFSDEIMEMDGRLNFYLESAFDVDKVFGTHVLTDANDDWLNAYANYDTAARQVCDALEITICKGDGSEEERSYPLNAAEKEVVRGEMEDFCLRSTGRTLSQYCDQLTAEKEAPAMDLRM